MASRQSIEIHLVPASRDADKIGTNRQDYQFLKKSYFFSIKTLAEAVKAAKDKVKLQTLREGIEAIQSSLDARFQLKTVEELASGPSVCDAFRLPYDFGFCSRRFKVSFSSGCLTFCCCLD